MKTKLYDLSDLDNNNVTMEETSLKERNIPINYKKFEDKILFQTKSRFKLI